MHIHVAEPLLLFYQLLDLPFLNFNIPKITTYFISINSILQELPGIISNVVAIACTWRNMVSNTSGMSEMKYNITVLLGF